MSANRRRPKITESCTIKENIGRLIARCRKERNVGKFYSKISSTILRNWEIRGNYNPGVASRRFSLSFYRGFVRRIGEKRNKKETLDRARDSSRKRERNVRKFCSNISERIILRNWEIRR